MLPSRIRLREFLRYKFFPRALAVLERVEALLAFGPGRAGTTEKRDAVLILNHGMGGGADKQALAEALHLAGQGKVVYTLHFNVARRAFTLGGAQGQNEVFMMPWHANRLWRRLDRLGVAHVHLHHIRYWPSYIVAGLMRYLQSRQPAFAVTLHDYYYLCPRIHLLDRAYRFCGLPADASICMRCVKSGGSFAGGGFDVGKWRATHEKLLRQTSHISAPSRDCAERYKSIWPWLEIEVHPHEEEKFPPPKAAAGNPVLSIAVVGNLQRQKGADIVLAAARYCRMQALPVVFTVIGECVYAPELRDVNVSVTGSYRSSDLPRLLEEAKADYAWIPSPWPETYSFVLSEIWNAGYRAVLFDLGAPAERTRARGGEDLILPLDMIGDIPSLCSSFVSRIKADA